MNFSELNGAINALERLTDFCTEIECNTIYDLISAEYSRSLDKLSWEECEHIHDRLEDASNLIEIRNKQEKENEEENLDDD